MDSTKTNRQVFSGRSAPVYLICFVLILVFYTTEVSVRILILAALIAALYISCLGMQQVAAVRTIFPFIRSIFLGLCIGIISLLYYGYLTGAVDCGIQEQEIQFFDAVLLEDSRKRITHTEYKISLRRVYGREISATGKGTMRIRIVLGDMLAAGSKIRVYASPEKFRMLYPHRIKIQNLGFSTAFWTLRADIMEALRKRILLLPARCVGLFRALFLGELDLLDEFLIDDFRASGTIHVLALSGMHLTVLIGMAQCFLRPLLGMRGSMVAGLITGCIYIILVGPRPSLIRAYCMYALYIASRIFDYPVPAPVIAVSSIVLLSLLKPVLLIEASFQLSSLAVLGIIVIGSRFYNMVRTYIPPFVGGALGASVGAVIATSPVSLYYFGSVYFAGILASVPIGGIISLFFVLGILAIIFPFSLYFLSPVLSMLYAALEFLTGIFSRISPINELKGIVLFFFSSLFCIIFLWRVEICGLFQNCRHLCASKGLFRARGGDKTF